MATTGTTAFNPSTSNIVLNALSRNQIRGSDITTEHLINADMEANLALVQFGSLQPNLWTSELGSVSLSAGTATYTLASTVTDITIIYLEMTQGGVTTDRVLGPISTTEYASFPNKTTEGVPTSFWFNRQITPTLTFWPVPDDTATYVAKYRYLRQTYDASAKSGYTMDLPWRWLDAYGWELTARMAVHYKPDFYEKWQAVADKKWIIAAGEDVENVNMYLTPGLSTYYR